MLRTVVRHGIGVQEPVEEWTARRTFAFCGLANPDSFRSSLEKAGMRVVGFAAFADHHSYTQADADRLAKACIAADAELLLTTEKDYVKIRTHRWAVPLAVARGETIFDEEFNRFLENRLRIICRKSEGNSGGDRKL